MHLSPSNNSRLDATPQRRNRSTLVLVFAAFAWMILSASPAFADEFKVGIILDPATSDSTFMEGFQLAVDQSPDVSHPPGVEGGDHLGSMDVVMVVVDDVTGPDGLLAAANRLVEGEGVAIVVADISPDALRAIVGPVTESGTMLLDLSNVRGDDLPDTPLMLMVGNQDGTDALLTDRTPTFQDAFVAAYGHTPSEAAVRGYIAGRLVDAGVEATDRDPSDTGTLAKGLAATAGLPVEQTAGGQPESPTTSVSTTSDTTTLAGETEPPNDPQVSSGLSGALVVLIVLGTAAVGGLGIRASLSQRPRTPR